MSVPLLIADLFCGAGGSTSGAMRAVRAMGRRAEVVAVNHWDLAIVTHTQNHPEARHHRANVDDCLARTYKTQQQCEEAP